MCNNHTTNDERAQVFLRGKVIGGITFDNVFRKHLCASKHFLRRPPSIAFDCDVLNQAEAEGATDLLVIDDESGREYRTSIKEFRAHCFSVERGSGSQLALALNRWNRGDDDDKPKPTSELVQPALFPLSHLIR